MPKKLPTPGKPQLMLALGPTLLLFSFIFVFPTFFSVFYSLHNWTGGSSLKFVGLSNFVRFLHDESFWTSFIQTLQIVVIAGTGQVGFGLLVAVVLVLGYVNFVSTHRTVIFLPVVLSPVVVGLIWSMIYNSRQGLFKLLFTSLGIEDMPLWLGDPEWVIFSVSLPVVWQYTGLYMVMLLGALMNIPKSILESATIDGASGSRKLFGIMLPMIYPTFKVAVMLSVSGTLKIFDHIYVLTAGGPGESSMTMSMYNYIVSFNMMQFSYGSAISIGMIVITMTITLISIKAMGGKRYD